MQTERAIEEALEEIQKRLDAEESSLANQLAVIGYLKHRRIEEYLVRAYPEMYFLISEQVLWDAQREVMRDLNINALKGCLDFLIYDHDWDGGD